MTIYILTEVQRQQLLDASLAGVSTANILATKILRTGIQLAAPSTSQYSGISVELLERLIKTLTRLGYATPEGGIEAFNARIADQLYNLCGGIDSVLDRIQLAAPSTSQVDMDVLIDELTHTAACYHDYSSLRQRIADVVSAHIKGDA